MRFVPKSEDELNPLLLPGDYEAEVIKSDEAVSKSSGNDMIKICLKLYGRNGDTVLLNDYLLESFPKKLKHFCDSAGLMDVYESGELSAEHCKGVTVIARIKVKNDPQYGEQNAVEDYVTPSVLPKCPPPPKPKAEGTGKSAKQVAAVNAEFRTVEGNEIPF
jgi:hypothetical protein